MHEQCLVRPVAEHDLPIILGWRNDPAVRQVMRSQHEISLDEHRNWFAQARSDPERHLLMVCDPHGPIGFAQLQGVTRGGTAQWGFYVRPGSPRGSGRKLGGAVLDHAFGELGLHTVWGEVAPGNQASIGLHRALGFRQEGMLGQGGRATGEDRAMLYFELQSGEWLARRSERRTGDAVS